MDSETEIGDEGAEREEEESFEWIERELTEEGEALSELPPSAKLVYKTLEYEGEMTQGQLADETLLPPRTVRYAKNRLEEESLVDSRFSVTDARQRLYRADAEIYHD